MKKAKRTALFLLPFVLCSFIISVHTVFGSSISANQLQNVSDENTKRQIAKIVLEDTGKSIPTRNLTALRLRFLWKTQWETTRTTP